jgi:hypothetical protein
MTSSWPTPHADSGGGHQARSAGAGWRGGLAGCAGWDGLFGMAPAVTGGGGRAGCGGGAEGAPRDDEGGHHDGRPVLWFSEPSAWAGAEWPDKPSPPGGCAHGRFRNLT